jgi:hypothetical protein
MSDRMKFTPQFKADAVTLVLSSGRPIARVAPRSALSRAPSGTGCGRGKKNTRRPGRTNLGRLSGLSTKRCSSNSRS